MKTTITRSFSKTKQLGAYEPVNSFCSISQEFDDTEPVNITVHLMELDRQCREEVEKTIKSEISKHAVEVEAVTKNITF